MFELSGDDARDNALEAHDAAQNARIERLRWALDNVMKLADLEAQLGSEAWAAQVKFIAQILEDTK